MKKFLAVAAATGALMSAGAATDGPHVDFFGVAITDFTESVTLPKFDSSLGTLISVKYELYAKIDGSASIDSENPQPSNVNIKIGGKVTLRDGVTPLITLTPVANSGPIALTGDNDAAPDFLGTDAGSFAAAPDQAGSVNVLPANFGAFIGNAGDTFTWDVDAEGDSQATGSANLIFFVNQTAEGWVGVTYTYSDLVPETSTYLSGLGLLGVAALAGRRLLRR